MKKIIRVGALALIFLAGKNGFAQNVAINTTGTAAVASAMLDITSTSTGILIPRVALTATNAAGPIAAPATSLLVYNTATAGAPPTNVIPGYYYWDGAAWNRMATGNGTAWQILGNAGTVAGTNFIGTTDAIDFVTRTNNTEKMRVTSAGDVGVGIAAPLQRMHVSGNELVTGDIYVRNNLGASSLIGSVHHGANGRLGQATTFAPNSGAEGLWIEGSSDGESGGLFLNGNTAVLWSPGDADIFRVYDEDVMPAGNPAFVIDGGGEVGIGVNAPVYNLEVNGTFGFGNGTSGAYRSRTETRDNAGQAATQSGFFETSSPTNYPAGATGWWHLIDVRHSNNGNNYALQIAGYFFDQELWFRKTNNNGAQAWTKILTSASFGCATTNYVPKMSTSTTQTCSQIYDDGANVGIATAAPTQKLDVQGGNARINNTFIGDVGHGAGWGGISHSLQNNTTGYAMISSSDGNYTLINKQNTGGGYIGFRVANADVAVILNNGNMGIGTTAPSTKLHVVGDADNLPIIYGINTNATGGTTSYGVRGESGSSGLGSAGVSGVSTNSGQNEMGVLGDYSLWGASIFGLAWASAYTDMPATRDYGVFGVVNFSTGTGVYGKSLQLGTSYGVYSAGNFAATGAKAASVPTTKGNQLLYCQESPEMWFEDIGSAQLVNGVAVVKLDKLFMETVKIDASHPMQVFIQENGESNGVYVVKENDQFIVKEKNGGTSNIEFSYRILAKRRFYEDHRFGVDVNQDFGDNLAKAKYNEPTTQDPIKMKAYVDRVTAEKEAQAASEAKAKGQNKK